MLKELSEIMGVSGAESRIRAYIKSEIADRVEEIYEDAYGNLIVRKNLKKEKLRIMLAAHMDEVGIMITGIEKDGLLRFSTIGIPAQVLLAKRVVVGEKRVYGVIGHKPIHQTSGEEVKKYPEIKDLFIDIGVTSKEAAGKLVEIGDCGTFDTEFREIDGTLYGKAFDNRLGCYILMQLIKQTDLPIFYAFTVQEEAGLRGAGIAAYHISPHVAIAIDTTSSAEWPVEKDLPQYPRIGKGPVLTIADRSVICDNRLVVLLEETAQEHKLDYQFKQPMVGGTDAGAIHLVKEGTRTAVMSTAARYIHSPVAIAVKKDLEVGIRLLGYAIDKILTKRKLWN